MFITFLQRLSTSVCLFNFHIFNSVFIKTTETILTKHHKNITDILGPRPFQRIDLKKVNIRLNSFSHDL